MARYVSLLLLIVAIVASSVQGFSPSLGGVSGGGFWVVYLTLCCGNFLSSLMFGEIISFSKNVSRLNITQDLISLSPKDLAPQDLWPEPGNPLFTWDHRPSSESSLLPFTLQKLPSETINWTKLGGRPSACTLSTSVTSVSGLVRITFALVSLKRRRRMVTRLDFLCNPRFFN